MQQLSRKVVLLLGFAGLGLALTDRAAVRPSTQCPCDEAHIHLDMLNFVLIVSARYVTIDKELHEQSKRFPKHTVHMTLKQERLDAVEPSGALRHVPVHVQSLEAMQGAVQQEMSCLRAERGTFRDLVHDAKWAARQSANPDQASVSIQPKLGLPQVLAYHLRTC